MEEPSAFFTLCISDWNYAIGMLSEFDWRVCTLLLVICNSRQESINLLSWLYSTTLLDCDEKFSWSRASANTPIYIASINERGDRKTNAEEEEVWKSSSPIEWSAFASYIVYTTVNASSNHTHM